MLSSVKAAIQELDNMHLITDIDDLPKLTFSNNLYCIEANLMKNCLQEKQPNYGGYRKFEKKKF